jgi:hypothetical protein
MNFCTPWCKFPSTSSLLSDLNQMEKSSSQRISTRRKSCVACVKAKRRCDLHKPCFTRCRTRGLFCIYVSRDIDLVTKSISAFEYPPFNSSYIPALDPIFGTQFDDFLNTTLVPSRNVYLSKDKLDCCVQYCKGYLKKLIQQGRTLFINPNFYSDTDVLHPYLQDVYLICGAYLSKTAANENLIFQILSTKLEDLFVKRQYHCSIKDELASVQALIIYQTIRLFDGDIRRRGIAEDQFQILDAWAIRLRQQSEFDLSPSIQVSPYRKWLFIESIQRTVLMSIFLKAIYYAIKDGFCDKVPEMAGLPLTVKGELWEAKSEGEWMQATRGTQPDVLTYHEFVEVWDGGRVGNDVENFQKMLLVACIGEEGLQKRFSESLTMHVGWA